MALHLITGYAGREHITSQDQGAYNEATFGAGEFVLERGNKFAHQVLTNNSVRISDGEAMMQGRFIRMAAGTTEEISIDNGSQGKYRNDLICIKYSKDASSSVEKAEFVVIKGAETTGTPADPTYQSGDITDGTATVNHMPLYRVRLNGINIESVTPLFEVKISMVEYMDNYELLPATADRLGGVKVGAGLNINAQGVLSAKNLEFVEVELTPVNCTIPGGFSAQGIGVQGDTLNKYFGNNPIITELVLRSDGANFNYNFVCRVNGYYISAGVYNPWNEPVAIRKVVLKGYKVS